MMRTKCGLNRPSIAGSSSPTDTRSRLLARLPPTRARDPNLASPGHFPFPFDSPRNMNIDSPRQEVLLLQSPVMNANSPTTGNEVRNGALLKTPPRRPIIAKKKSYPWKPPRPQLRPRTSAVMIPRSKVDTAPMIPSTARMDLPLFTGTSSSPLTIHSPNLSLVSTTRNDSNLTLQHLRQRLSPRHAPIQGYREQDHSDPPAGAAPHQPLPKTLQLPDLPDMETPSLMALVRRDLEENGTRAPCLGLPMKPLSRLPC